MAVPKIVLEEGRVWMGFVLVGPSGQVQLVTSPFVHTTVMKMDIVMLSTTSVFVIQHIQVTFKNEICLALI